MKWISWMQHFSFLNFVTIPAPTEILQNKIQMHQQARLKHIAKPHRSKEPENILSIPLETYTIQQKMHSILNITSLFDSVSYSGKWTERHQREGIQSTWATCLAYQTIKSACLDSISLKYLPFRYLLAAVTGKCHKCPLNNRKQKGQKCSNICNHFSRCTQI